MFSVSLLIYSSATKLIFQQGATGSDIKINWFVKSTDETLPGHRKALLQEDQTPNAAEKMGFNEWQILGQQ